MSIYSRLSVLSDPTRVRLLVVLEREELGVGELVRVLGVPQSTVSRHLKVLLEDGWLQKRTVGTSHLYRCTSDALPAEARSLWEVVASQVQDELADDLRRLEAVVALRQVDSREFFGRHGQGWDALKQDLYGTDYLLPTLTALLPPDLVVADLGCGTGTLALDLATSVRQVFAVDREEQMVQAARQRTAHLDNVEVYTGELCCLPLEDASVDVALCVLVLHYVEELVPSLAELRRVLRPGGRLVVLDMDAHDRVEYRRTMGHEHLGFSAADLAEVSARAHLSVRCRRALPHSAELLGPPLFLAVLEATRP